MNIRRQDIIKFQEVRKFIEKNSQKNILVDSLCRDFGINRTKMQLGFHQLFGISVHSFISRARMDRACILLTETDDSIKSVAFECGYRTASSFSRIFSKLIKVSPKKYRSLVSSNGKRSDKITGSDN